MPAPHAHQVTLQLRYGPTERGDGSGEQLPVEGEVECADGTIRPFTGWLGLVNELERVVAEGDAG